MPTWIFDLDNTLHDAEPYIFPAMNRLMTDYVAAHVGVDKAEADRLRLKYWQEHGTTLAGLIHHHGHIDPHHFLRETHRFPDLLSELRPMHGLYTTLLRLPGRKILFTNAPLGYALTVVRGLGIAHLFDGVLGIQQTGMRPKPNPVGYRRILARFRLRASDCIMVEDTAANLVTARRLGMRTVLLQPAPGSRHGADIVATSLVEMRRRCLARGWI
jgi:putative hydrolase of the HAD superfamily